MKAQFDFINDINEKMTEIHQALKNIQKIRGQVGVLKEAIKDKETHKALLEFADALVKDMTKIEEALYQTKSKSGQDPLNFPIRLNNKLAHLNSLTRIGNYAPTQQAIDFKNDIVKDIDLELKNLYSLFDTGIRELNQKVKESNIDLIQLD
jgi:two-component sensor histidine kinase